MFQTKKKFLEITRSERVLVGGRRSARGGRRLFLARLAALLAALAAGL